MLEENKDLSMLAQAEMVKEHTIREIDKFYANTHSTALRGETIRTVKGYLIWALQDWNDQHEKAEQISLSAFGNLMYSLDMAFYEVNSTKALNCYENQK